MSFPPPASPDPNFIPARSFTDEGTPYHALSEAYHAYAQERHGGEECRAEFLATEEGARLKAEAYPNGDPQ